MKISNRKRDRKNEKGQILILLAFVMIGLMLTSALAIDVSFAYMTRARLVKAVDAACLLGMTNLSQGQTKATTAATNTFAANYPTTSLDANAPTVSVSFTQNAGQQLVNVTGTATIRTIFLGLLPGYRTLTVSANAQALRGYLAMTVVIDRSGSMTSNGGKQAVQAAVPVFIKYFNNSIDQVALTSFASNATTDFPIATSFQTPIINDIANTNFNGGTFGLGGLVLAKAQEDSVIPQTGQNLVKAVVYFTDGLVNEAQDTFACTNWGNTLYNYGGYDSGTTVDFFNPTDGTDWGTGLTGSGSQKGPPHSPSPQCYGVTTFTSQIDGTQKSFTRANVSADAVYRAKQTANAMRAEGIYVYSIGLGSDPSQTFLQEIANDPSSDTYNSSQPTGMAIMAPDCSTPNSQTCNTELQQVFQTIAAKILLRLTQ